MPRSRQTCPSAPGPAEGFIFLRFFALMSSPNHHAMSEKNWDVSNRVFWLIVVLGAGLLLFWVFRVAQIWQEMNGDYAREISVEAEGSAFVIPDTAVVNLGVTTDGETSEAVVEQNTEKMNAVLEAIKGLGIEESKIQTTGYYLYPKYNWTEEGQETDGYTLTQNVEVRISDFELIGEVIAQSSTAGANMVGGVDFTLDDPDSAKMEARLEAVAEAKMKAEQIADAAGLKLGDVVNYYEYSYSGGKGGGYYYDDFAEGAALENAPSIEPGEEEVTLTVTLTYQLK